VCCSCGGWAVYTTLPPSQPSSLLCVCPAAGCAAAAALQVFSIVPLSLNEWLLVLLFALPVIVIDEVLKFLGRHFFGVKHVVPQKRESQTKAAAAKLKAA